MVCSFAGQVRAFDTRTGALLWQRALGSSCESSPLVLDGRVYLGIENGTAYALSLSRGARSGRAGRAARSPAASPSRAGDVVVGDYSGNVFALRASDGRLRWRARVGGQIYATPAVADGRVFVTSSTEKDVTALDARDGSLIWSQRLSSFAYPAAGRRRAGSS